MINNNLRNENINRIYLPITEICKNTLKNEYENKFIKNDDNNNLQKEVYNNYEFPNEGVIIQFGLKRRRYQPTSIDVPLFYDPKNNNFDEDNINEICQALKNCPPIPSLFDS